MVYPHHFQGFFLFPLFNAMPAVGHQPEPVAKKADSPADQNPKIEEVALEKQKIDPHQVVAVSSKAGTAMLLNIRDTFKNPFVATLYTIFVLAAAFHASNGFWTFLITWGWIISARSQRAMIPLSLLGMLFLGPPQLHLSWLLCKAGSFPC